MNKKIIYFVIIMFLIFLLTYNQTNRSLEKLFGMQENFVIDRVIDGDTIVSGNESIRLLGINTPERGEKYFEEAKEFVEELVLNEEVELIFGTEKRDKYKRLLAYIYFQDQNINKKIIEEGFGNIYFPSGKDNYYNYFLAAWEDCTEKNIRLCKTSESVCGKCIKLEKFDYQKRRVIIRNSCGIDCDLSGWILEHEGRRNFILEDFISRGGEHFQIIIGNKKSNSTHLFWDTTNSVWSKTGDSVFLRDSEKNLVFWKSY